MAQDGEATADKPFVVWTDYGLEGWKPRGFEELRDALDFMQGGTTFKVVLTRRMRLQADDWPTG